MVKKTGMVCFILILFTFFVVGCASKSYGYDSLAYDKEIFEEGPLKITKEVAQEILEDKIDTENYTVALEEENALISNKEYYIFCVSKGNTMITPSIAVRVTDGEIFCCAEDFELSSFSDFPLKALKKQE